MIVNRLEMEGLRGLTNSIEVEKIITPDDLESNYLTNRGSIYGLSSNNRFSVFLRPRNKSSKVDGLYLVGGSTHPGGGIPLVTLSALNAHGLFNRK